MLTLFKNAIIHFFQTIISVVRIIKGNNILAYNKLNNLEHTYPSKTLRILGNGNSLTSEIESFNTDAFDYMVVNRHVNSDSYIQLQPKYYVLADPHFFSHPEGLNILHKINKNTCWDLYLFIRYSRANKKIGQSIFNDNKHIRLVFYNGISFKGFETVKYFLYHHNLAIPKLQNVLAAAIYISVCLKHKTVELYGVEHSWVKHLSVNANNEVCLLNPHFFDSSKVEVKTWKQIQHQDARLCDVLRMYANMFEPYFELNYFAKQRAVDIINCTKDSFIDAFNRKTE